MKREQRLIKQGYRVQYLMNTCDQNKGRMMVMVGNKKYTSVSSAHKHLIGY